MLQIKSIRGTSRGPVFEIYSDEGKYLRNTKTGKLHKKILTTTLDMSQYEESNEKISM